MISIIVPIYNVDRFLRKCLNSVLKQTYADWECILVNDASPDNSLNICNEYAKKDPRFIIENKLINEGLQKARYDGFLKSSGDYIMHLDADDWVEPTILATCLNLIEKYNCDYVETTIGRAIGRWRTSFSNKPGGRHIKHPELGKYIISFFGINSIGCSLCGKLYRADFLRLHYPEPVGLAYAEDAYVNLKLFPHLQSIYISNEVCYNHRWGGMTSKYNPRFMADAKKYYWLRREVLETTDIPNARYFLDVEAKNILKSDISQRILYTNNVTIKDSLAEELKEQMWIDVRSNLSSHPLRDEFSRMLIEANVDEMIQSTKIELRRTKLKRICKNFVLKLLTSI